MSAAQRLQPTSARVSIDTLLRHRVALLGALLLGAYMRIARLGFVTLWSDEYWTIRNLRQPLRLVLTGQYPGDLNPPLYYSLLRLLGLKGDELLWLRTVSIATSLLSLCLVYVLAADWFGRRAGRWALAVAALHPLLAYYSTEIRAYAMLVCVSLLAWVAYGRVRRGTRPQRAWRVALVLALAAALYLHHSELLLFASLGLFWLADAALAQARPRLDLLACLVAAAGSYLPGWWFVLRRQLGAYDTLAAAPFTLADWLFLLIGRADVSLPVGVGAAACVLVCLVVGLALAAAHPASRAFGVAAGLWLLAAALGPYAAAALGINVVPRYLLPAAALLPALMAAVLRAPGRRRRASGLIGALTTAAIPRRWPKPSCCSKTPPSRSECCGWSRAGHDDKIKPPGAWPGGFLVHSVLD